MMLDAALEPKTDDVANIARIKNIKTHELLQHVLKFDLHQDSIELLLRTAFPHSGLGMPRNGFEENLININGQMLRNFQKTHFTPDRCIIVANGLKDHDEFVYLV